LNKAKEFIDKQDYDSALKELNKFPSELSNVIKETEEAKEAEEKRAAQEKTILEEQKRQTEQKAEEDRLRQESEQRASEEQAKQQQKTPQERLDEITILIAVSTTDNINDVFAYLQSLRDDLNSGKYTDLSQEDTNRLLREISNLESTLLLRKAVLKIQSMNLQPENENSLLALLAEDRISPEEAEELADEVKKIEESTQTEPEKQEQIKDEENKAKSKYSSKKALWLIPIGVLLSSLLLRHMLCFYNNDAEQCQKDAEDEIGQANKNTEIIDDLENLPLSEKEKLKRYIQDRTIDPYVLSYALSDPNIISLIRNEDTAEGIKGIIETSTQSLEETFEDYLSDYYQKEIEYKYDINMSSSEQTNCSCSDISIEGDKEADGNSESSLFYYGYEFRLMVDPAVGQSEWYNIDQLVQEMGAFNVTQNSDGSITATGQCFVSPNSNKCYKMMGFKETTSANPIINGSTHTFTSSSGTQRAYWATFEEKQS